MRKLLRSMLLVVLLGACTTQARINEVGATGDGVTISIGLSGCNSEYEIDVVESSESVMVTATELRSPFRLGGESCQDGYRFDLEEPLGSRDFIDGGTGHSVEVSYEPWNQQKYSEDEYRSALMAMMTCVTDADPAIQAVVNETPDGPQLEITYPELPEGGTYVDSTFDCHQRYVEPLRH